MSVSNEQERKQVTAAGEFVLCISLSSEKTEWKKQGFPDDPSVASHILRDEGESTTEMLVIFVRTHGKKLPSVNARNANLVLVVQR